MNIKGKKFCRWPKPRLKRGRAYLDGVLVTFPCSYRYNGGVVWKGKWYEGFSVPNPFVPKGYELVSIACGTDLNARPPQATMLLRKKTVQAKSS